MNLQLLPAQTKTSQHNRAIVCADRFFSHDSIYYTILIKKTHNPSSEASRQYVFYGGNYIRTTVDDPSRSLPEYAEK
jgi:hypothetical protein